MYLSVVELPLLCWQHFNVRAPLCYLCVAAVASAAAYSYAHWRKAVQMHAPRVRQGLLAAV